MIGGLLSDRIGRRNAIAFSMISAGVLTLALWQAHTLALIYPLMFGVACVGEIHRPASGALIADLVPSEGRVAAFTMFRLAVNVGWAAGLALGGFLAERSFDLLFVGDAATSIAFGVISLAALPHGTRTARSEEAHLPSARASILSDPGLPPVPRWGRCSPARSTRRTSRPFRCTSAMRGSDRRRTGRCSR